jgi:hypothetical protein
MFTVLCRTGHRASGNVAQFIHQDSLFLEFVLENRFVPDGGTPMLLQDKHIKSISVASFNA